MTMRIDQRAFRQTVGLFATGVTVIATEIRGDVHAMTANAVTSLSLDPLLVLFCVGKHARTAALVREAPGFSINILREDQEALSTYFAGFWREAAPPPHRFVPWEGLVRLEGTAGVIGCAVHDIVEGGDHWIVIGRVTALHRDAEPCRPLLFYGGRYHRMSSLVEAPAPDLTAEDADPKVYYDPSPKDL
jgi:flavin reductase (DIM6/NTAB) family NADH-FMN oxidoreductase RutF